MPVCLFLFDCVFLNYVAILYKSLCVSASKYYPVLVYSICMLSLNSLKFLTCLFGLFLLLPLLTLLPFELLFQLTKPVHSSTCYILASKLCLPFPMLPTCRNTISIYLSVVWSDQPGITVLWIAIWHPGSTSTIKHNLSYTLFLDLGQTASQWSAMTSMVDGAADTQFTTSLMSQPMLANARYSFICDGLADMGSGSGSEPGMWDWGSCSQIEHILNSGQIEEICAI